MFYGCKSGKFGVHNVCKSCKKEAQRIYRAKYPEKYRLLGLKSNRSERWKKWRKEHPEKLKEYGDKSYFSGNREKAIQRDGEKCTKCGLTRKQHFITFGKDITVHHIDGNGKNNIVKEKNNSLENLVTLCLKCHGAEDSKRQFVKL
jgi:5-methylcytosine-specific restriction endonuclease McrA